jgi:3,4-dihydroxy 2-butanone 4-phosphate synthase/GTP cyclohydrolase II
MIVNHSHSHDESHNDNDNYTVSVDAADLARTGIGAKARSHTFRVLADPSASPESLKRPGHIQPIRVVEGGVRECAHHAEAAIDLLKFAGLNPVAVTATIIGEDGEVMNVPDLIELGERMNFPVITIAGLIDFLNESHGNRKIDVCIHEFSNIIFKVETRIPTSHGRFRVRAYHDRITHADHVVLIYGELMQHGVLVRVHSECLTGEAFGSLKCECRAQLEDSLETIHRDGGVVVYLRGHKGRGIGLINKLCAYRLQEEEGLDTLGANVNLGLPVDARDYTAASDILRDLGIESVRLLTNNPDKVKQLRSHGITVDEQVPIVVGVGDLNKTYLETKRDRMGHVIRILGVRQ